jgi:hypothetical protein
MVAVREGIGASFSNLDEVVCIGIPSAAPGEEGFGLVGRAVGSSSFRRFHMRLGLL